MEWLDFNIQLHGSWLFLLLVPGVIAFSITVYRLTQPRAPHRLRVILTVLRSLSAVLLLLLLVEPVLNLLLKRTVPPTIITLLDASASMAIGDSVTRLEHAKRILESPAFTRLRLASEMQTWAFANEPFRVDLDTLGRITPQGSATDLAAALKAAISAATTTANNHLSGVVLLSDGTHNYGADPLHVAEELLVPVYAIGLGDGADLVTDAQITDTRIEAPAVAGRPLSVRVALRSWGLEGADAAIRLMEGDRELAMQVVKLQGETGQPQEISLRTTPDEAGPHIYRIEMAPLEGEISRDNNQSLIATRVAPGRMSVMVVAGAPSPEYGFLRRTLASDSTFAIDEFVQRGHGGDFYHKGAADFSASLKSGPEVIVLVDVGTELLSGALGAAIATAVRGGSGLLFVGGTRSLQDWVPDTPVAVLLPFVVARGTSLTAAEVALKLAPDGLRHSLMRKTELHPAHGGAARGEKDPWSRLPPLAGHLPGLTLRSGAVELVEGVGSHGSAAVVVSSGPAAQATVIAALSSEFWRLDLLSSGAGESPQTIRRFWHNAVRWLAIEHPSGRVRASTDRRVYMGGEPVEFLVQVFDELMKPYSGAQVRILLEGGDHITLAPGDPGLYSGSRSGLAPGEHSFTARAQLPNGDHLGESSGRFVVQEYSLEVSDMRATPELLVQLARVTGGTFHKADSWPGLLREMHFPPTRLQQEQRAIELWGRDWYLVLLVALLCVEWGLRKRQGML